MQLIVIIGFVLAFTLADSISNTTALSTVTQSNYQAWLGTQLTNREILILIIGSLLLTGIIIKLIATLLLNFMNKSPDFDKVPLHLPAKFDLIIRAIVLLTFAGQLTFCGWEELIYKRWALQRYFMLAEICLIAPFVLLLLMQWYFFYPVNRFVRQYFISDQIAAGNTNCAVWTLREYISFQTRHILLIVLVPIFLIMAVRDATDLFLVPFLKTVTSPSNAAAVGEVFSFTGAIMVFVLAPVILRYIWRTRALPAGELRNRLESFCAAIKLPFRDILLWETGHGLSNAAVTGLFSKVRYILMTDALLENMPPNEIEAVCGHEAGHVKFHHIIFLVLMVIAGVLWGSLLAELISRWLTDYYSNGKIWGYLSVNLTTSIIAGVLFVLWILLFGWVSRRFERQADVYGAWATDFTEQQTSLTNTNIENPKATHNPDTTVNADSDIDNPNVTDTDTDTNTSNTNINVTLNVDITYPNTKSHLNKPKLNDTILSTHGAAIMCSALYRIARLNGITPQRRSWRHSSIASRIDFLQQLATSNGMLSRFMNTVFYIKLMILLTVATGVTGWYFVS